MTVQYWQIDKPEELVDSFLRYSRDKVQFRSQLPVHIDFFGLVDELKSFIGSTESEKTTATLINSPGIGKTTSYQTAAMVLT